MKKIRWNQEKSQLIQDNEDRGISLELIAEYIQAGAVLDTLVRTKYPDQKAFVVLIEEKVWCVPFREDEESVTLITAWPDREIEEKVHMKKKVKPMDELEAAWMQDIEEGAVISSPQTTERLAGGLIADQSLKKSHPLSIRIPEADLEAIQLKAAKEGIPYQTLIKSILHKFATNQS